MQAEDKGPTEVRTDCRGALVGGVGMSMQRHMTGLKQQWLWVQTRPMEEE